MRAPAHERPVVSPPRAFWLVAGGVAAGALMIAAVGVALTERVVAGYEEGATAFNWRDYPTALAELEPLAQQGDWRAQALLGRMYRDGEGVAQDNVRAYHWFDRAAAGGDAESAVARDALAERMTAAEIDKAKGLDDAMPVAGRRVPPAAASPPTLEPPAGPAPFEPAHGRLAQSSGRLDRATIMDLQWQLAVHGYDPGPADGVAGAGTRAAIRDYQADAGLPADGQPTRELLDHLQYAAPSVRNGDPDWEPSTEALAGLGDEPEMLSWPAGEDIADEAPLAGDLMAAYTIAVQEELAARGYEVGSVDGVAGAHTSRSIRRYQSDAGLAVDGEVSLDLVNHLRLIAAN